MQKELNRNSNISDWGVPIIIYQTFRSRPNLKRTLRADQQGMKEDYKTEENARFHIDECSRIQEIKLIYYKINFNDEEEIWLKMTVNGIVSTAKKSCAKILSGQSWPKAYA